MQFLSKPPRELKGADTSGKYDYQKDVSICLLLEYHQQGQEYLFVFDYHDDLVVFNSDTSPSSCSFFQIKGHDKGSYSLTQILATKNVKKPTGVSNSILGKMYSHIVDFKSEVKSINFLTNRNFSIPHSKTNKSDQYQEICLNDLNPSAISKINTKLIKEFNVSSIDPDFQKLAFLKVNNLSVKDSSGHAKGKLSEFLQLKYPGIKTNPDLMYQNIFDEVKRKSRYDSIVTSFDELKQKKSIGKSYFEQMLSVLGTTKNYDILWSQIASTLSQENVKSGTILHYKNEWKKLEIERMDPNNTILKDALKEANRSISLKMASFREKTIMEIIHSIKPDIQKYSVAFSDDFLDAIILSAIYE